MNVADVMSGLMAMVMHVRHQMDIGYGNAESLEMQEKVLIGAVCLIRQKDVLEKVLGSLQTELNAF